MNISIARSNTASWLRRGIAVASALLVGGTVALGLSAQTSGTATTAAAPTAHMTAATERFAAMKQAQAEAHEPRAASWVPFTTSSGQERFAAMKQAQAEAHEPRAASWVPFTTSSGQETISGQERFAAMKQAQAEAREPRAASWVPFTTSSGQETISGRTRFAAMKQAQAEAHEVGSVPIE